MNATHKRAPRSHAAKPRTNPLLTYTAVLLVVAFAIFGACGASSDDSSTESTGSGPPEVPFTVEGHAGFVSHNFILEPGKYRATINVSGNSDQSGTPKSFIVTLYPAALGHPSLLVEAATESGNWQRTTTVRDRQALLSGRRRHWRLDGHTRATLRLAQPYIPARARPAHWWIAAASQRSPMRLHAASSRSPVSRQSGSPARFPEAHTPNARRAQTATPTCVPPSLDRYLQRDRGLNRTDRHRPFVHGDLRRAAGDRLRPAGRLLARF